MYRYWLLLVQLNRIQNHLIDFRAYVGVITMFAVIDLGKSISAVGRTIPWAGDYVHEPKKGRWLLHAFITPDIKTANAV